MSQLTSLEQQLKAMQQKLAQIKTEEEAKTEFQYKGPNMKIKLIIGNKEFLSDAHTLYNKQYGNTLFYQHNVRQKQNIEGSKPQPGSDKHEKELFFARDPKLFPHIIDYLSGYYLRNTLRNLPVIDLERLQSDAQYFQVKPLYDLITSSLNLRYNPYMKSPLLELNEDQTCVIRTAQQPGLDQCVAVYGVMQGNCKRYIDFTVLSHGDLYVKLGVAEAKPFRITRFPGRAEYPGCSFYGSTGVVYRKGGTEALGGGKWKFGDRIGIGVELNAEQDAASVGFYINGTLMKNKFDLKQYMDVKKGVVFVTSLYTANDCVCINQDPVLPQSF
eukprot:709883_1